MDYAAAAAGAAAAAIASYFKNEPTWHPVIGWYFSNEIFVCWHFTSPHVKQSVFCLSRGAFEPLGRQICRFTGGSSSPRPNIRARRRYRGSPMRDGTGFQTALHFEDGRMSLLGVGVGMITVVGITTGFEPGIQPPCSYKGIYFELCFLPTNVLVRLPSHS